MELKTHSIQEKDNWAHRPLTGPEPSSAPARLCRGGSPPCQWWQSLTEPTWQPGLSTVLEELQRPLPCVVIFQCLFSFGARSLENPPFLG